MLCKYKFILMNNEYNHYFNSFTKEYPPIISSLNLTRTRTSWLWLEDGLNGLHNKSLTLSLLEIYCSSSLRIWRIWGLLKFMKAFKLNSNRTSKNFFECSWGRISPELWRLRKIGVEWEEVCPLFIVVSKDKSHLDWSLCR